MHEAAFTNPHLEAGRRLWYATAIGTAPFLADVIVAQVEQFSLGAWRRNGGRRDASGAGEASSSLPAAIPAWRMGEVLIERGCELRHRDDAGREDLRELASLAEIRELVRLDEKGNFRPLRAAPNLRRGWRYRARGRGLRCGRRSTICIRRRSANAALWREDKLAVTPWRETAERQTGRFRVVRELDDAGVCELVAQVCERGCLKRRLWAPADQEVDVRRRRGSAALPGGVQLFRRQGAREVEGPGDGGSVIGSRTAARLRFDEVAPRDLCCRGGVDKIR